MASGFFAGGMAEGMETARRADLQEREFATNTGLRTRAADLAEKQFAAQQEQEAQTRGDKIISDLMTNVTETVKQGLAVGKDPETIYKAVQPVLGTAQALAGKVGRDPAALEAQTRALLTGPTGIEAATAAGRAEGTKTGVTQQTAANILTGEGANSFILDPAKRAETENKLRDDYLKESKTFTTVRDYRGNMSSLPTDVTRWTGADDIVAVFAFMKMQDPNSAVMPGEQANAANAGGVPEAVRGLYNRLLGGGSLGEGARTQLVDSADRIFRQRTQNYNDVTKQFEGIAKRQGLNPKNVIIEFNPDRPAPLAGAPRTAGPAIPAPPTNFQIVR